MNYQEALDYIWGQAKGLVNLEKVVAPDRTPYTLERMKALMARLDNPQDHLRAVHIAGTKGKGSTAAMVEAVLRAAGYSTGFYTSPHLHDPRERIRANGDMISEETFTDLANRLRPLFDSFQGTTTFEALTAMMFLWFAEQNVDVAVIEVGLGGRLDATNLITPLVSVITPLGLEHTTILGDTIEEIAGEKGGIIKPNVPVVVSTQAPNALQVLIAIAEERRAPLTVAPDQWHTSHHAVTPDGQTFDFVADNPTLPSYDNVTLRLLGRHQQQNAVVALAALTAIQETIAWDEAALRRGFASVEWAARVEIVQRDPWVIVDGAHTRESAAALVSTLRDLFGNEIPPATLVIGVSSDKDLAALLPVFSEISHRVILTKSNHPRAAEPDTLLPVAIDQGLEVQTTSSVAEALVSALAHTERDGVIVATGSLFVAAEARQAIRGSQV